MDRLSPVEIELAKGGTKKLLEKIQKSMGRVPNIFKLMAKSPATLGAYWKYCETLNQGVLDGKLREQIALAVSEENRCDYCLAAHTTIAKMIGLSETEIELARQSDSGNSRTDAALQFARAIVQTRGHVTDDEFTRLRSVGFSDEEIIEIVGNVVITIFTNYFNHVADTTIDFPRAKTTSLEV